MIEINCKKYFLYFFVIFFSVKVQLPAQQQPLFHFTIDENRIVYVNGEPFFPIGECYEIENPDKYRELAASGFNYINLFTQNHTLNSYFHSYDIISGDRSSGSQYDQLLQYWNTDYQNNANRIFDRAKSSNLYIMADDYFDWPDDMTVWHMNAPPYQDSVIISPPFNQLIRNQSISRLNQLAAQKNSRLMGGFALDDASLFQIEPNPPMYYYNNFLQSRINNFINTYNYFKVNNPDQIVFMKITPVYFPRIHDLNNWQNLDIVRQKWLEDAKQFVKGTDVLYATDHIDKRWTEQAPEYSLYDNAKPSTWLQHYDILMQQVGEYKKAVWGGLDYDVESQCGNPNLSAQQLHNIVKWHTYVGIIKGATGLIYFGQHHAFDQPQSARVWNEVKSTVSEMTNTLHLDKSVFIHPNSFSTGHTITGSVSNNLSYCVFKKNNDFSDYWLLVSNNPNGYSDEPEADNTVTINSSFFQGKFITELFSGHNFTCGTGNSITISMPWYGTAIFHVSDGNNSGNIPDIFSVKQFPNPFNPKTKIDFDITQNNSFVEFKVFDALGRELKKPVSEYKQPGHYEIEFDGSDLASGIYFLRVQIRDRFLSDKMVLIK